MLKNFLEEKKLPYTEKLVDQDTTAKEEMIEKSDGYLGVPFTVITKDDGSEVKIVGFDKNLFNQTLGV
jgi:glutaredoxin